LFDEFGKIQFDKDKEAARQYFLQHVNQNTVYFHTLEERLEYLIGNDYYESEFLEQYGAEFLQSIYDRAYSYHFRFESFVGAYKFYSSYALKTFDGKRYLERYEDRVVAVALDLAQGDERLAERLLDDMMSGKYQPATPTFLNCGKKSRGELVSCFLLDVQDNMESISRAIGSSLQLSKRGGGVSLNLTNLRETGAPIKNIENQSSGVIPVMKLLEDSFSYANQLGARQGAGAVYLNAHHPDLMRFLDTKRENADEKVRIKTLSIGVVLTDIVFEAARTNEDIYQFSPYSIQKEYGKSFAEISVTDMYDELVNNPNIRKTKVNARKVLQTIAELQFESGYPYIMFEDTVNRSNPVHGRISFSNLCSEILQVNSPSKFNDDMSYSVIGKDISCNLGSLNIAKVMDDPFSIGQTVENSIRSLTAVTDMTSIASVPSIRKANDEGRAIGLGQMNLHGFLGREHIQYGSPEALEFTSVYFATILFYALKASNQIAIERGEVFRDFSSSKYASGEFFVKYTKQDWLPSSDTVIRLFQGAALPSRQEWADLRDSVMQYGLYHQNLQAVPPTGSISYINNSTSSIHPIASQIEIRKEGKLGRVYYPAPYLNNNNREYYKDAYEVGYEKIIDTYAAATEHVDQGLSCTLFFPDTATTRDLNKAYIYAWRKGIKTLYYVRIRQQALSGTEQDGCVSCTL